MTASEIRVARDKKSLTIVWTDREPSVLSAALLRRGGQSADAVRARLDGRYTAPGRDVSIMEVKPIGAYAINITFSDGYHRGIYPWSYLAQLEAGDVPEQPAQAFIA